MPEQVSSLGEVTSWLIEELKEERAPWIRPWADLSFRVGGESFPINGWPSNIRSPRSYYGPLNMMFLAMQLRARGAEYRSDLWITPKALQKLGIPEGSWGRPYKIISFFHGYEHYTVVLREVFHVEQFDDCEKVIGFSFVEFDTDGGHEFRYKRSETALDTLRCKHQLHVREGKRYAAFHPVTDRVSMPSIDQFLEKHGKDAGEAHYWATMWHEVVHWTGHHQRLNRVVTGFDTPKKGYALEELVAETGAAYLCAHFGVKGELQHAEYIKSWLRVLEDRGEEALADAFVMAQKAAKWILKESR